MSYLPTRRDIRAAAESRPWDDSIAIYIHGRDVHGNQFVAKPLEFHCIAHAGLTPVETMKLPITAAQELMDQLWRCGLRPTEGTGSAGALAATQAHLDDMRRLCFEFAGVGKAKP